MARKDNPPEESRIDYYAISAYIFLILGVALLAIGSIGMILSVFLYPKIYDDRVLLYGLYFFYFYMIVLGAVFFFYHKRIIIKSRRT
jgi:hypothetical protein